jgi:hypothetical protein
MGVAANIFEEGSTQRIVVRQLGICCFVRLELSFILFLTIFFPTTPKVIDGVVVTIIAVVASVTPATRTASTGQSRGWSSKSFVVGLCRGFVSSWVCGTLP